MNDYFLQILIRERKRDILEEIRRCGYQTPTRRRGSGLSKGIAGRLLSALKKSKPIAGHRQKRLQAANILEEISDPMLSIDRKSFDRDMGARWN